MADTTRGFFLVAALAIGACAAPAQSSASNPSAQGPAPIAATSPGAADDGSYLDRIDPLGGQWKVERIGAADFTRFGGWVNFSGGGFLNHGAGCAGGHPAFYQLDGERLTIVRRERIQVGKCAGNREMAAASPSQRAANEDSERRLAAFLDQAEGWSRPDPRTLVLTARDGTTARLSRPVEPHPEIAGRWRIETIGGKPVVAERRPPTLVIGMGSIGAFADCNSMGSPFTIPAPGRIAVEGPVVSTAIGCAPEDAAEDDLMARAITSATGYRLEGERLVLTGGPGLVARRPPLPNRSLVGEFEAAGNTLLGAYHEGPLTLAITETEMRDNGGCVARYGTRGPDLEFELEDTAACADVAPPYVPGVPVAIGGDISLLAIARPSGFAFDEQGTLVLRTNRGLLTMRREGDPPHFGD